MLCQQIDEAIQRRESWVLRRQNNIPNDKGLLVVTCMDERTPIEQVLGLNPDDAHIFRNAGGLIGYVYEVETGHLRRPLGRLAERVNSASQMRVEV